MKKVLYISYDGLTDPLGQSQILPYLQILTKQGYQFTILSFEKGDRFQKEEKIIRAIVSDAGINWVPLSFTAHPPILSKIYDRFRMHQTAIRLHKETGFDLVHCRSYIAAETGLYLKKKFGLKMLFDMRGFWADEKVDNGQWNLKQAFYQRIYRHYKKKERDFLLEADGIVSLTEAAKDFLLKQPDYKHLSITVIPTCADLAHFDFHPIDADSKDALRRQLGIAEHDKIVTYLGSVGGWYLTREMFLFFKQLQAIAPEYKMLVLTKDDPVKVKREAQSVGLGSESLIVTYSARQNLPLYLSLSTLSLFFIRNSFSKIASSPTKLAELMGMGIPVICNAIGDTGKIIDATGAGLLLNDFRSEDFNAVLPQIKHLEQLPREPIRKAAKERFDLLSGAEKYQALYRRILPI